eukprot:TRINITY_DN5320_c0_g1_i6.p3 TRINITY_DN5320_c0_g1~~TRINITY_DN5320_c0_g1_i6.p3  ORF type:complete len:135 (-),score=5.83 TRINITY_DN5320_c0_g1_i6:146-550(-)
MSIYQNFTLRVPTILFGNPFMVRFVCFCFQEVKTSLQEFVRNFYNQKLLKIFWLQFEINNFNHDMQNFSQLLFYRLCLQLLVDQQNSLYDVIQQYFQQQGENRLVFMWGNQSTIILKVLPMGWQGNVINFFPLL